MKKAHSKVEALLERLLGPTPPPAGSSPMPSTVRLDLIYLTEADRDRLEEMVRGA